MWKELEGKTLTMDAMKFRPRGEVIADIETHIDAKDKRVLCVSSYGGYPILFLTQGATEVVSFDVSPDSVAWNYFLQSLIAVHDFSTNRDFLDGQEPLPPTEISFLFDSVIPHIPSPYQKEARELMHHYRFQQAYSHFSPATVAYPHIRNPHNFEQAKRAIEEQRWTIEEKELTTLLEERALEGNNGFDVIYLSNIRNWITRLLIDKPLGLRSVKEVEKASDKVDGIIGSRIASFLNNGGSLYEVLISMLANDDSIFPALSAHYPGVQFQLFSSVDAKMRDAGILINVGRKE